jgi:dTDP-4-dehydrorhamnose 3,5-epimerase
MHNQSQDLREVVEFDLTTFPDDRGFFKEVIRTGQLEEKIGKPFVTRQVNHSRSTKNTLRGIHIAPWNKLIYVVHGTVQSVIVDCRKGSPTFGKYKSVILGEDNRSCIFVPAGCGNSYLVLSEDADYLYLTDQEWTPNQEKGVAWNDKDLAIDWQLSEADGEPTLSEKDKNNPSFSAIFSS